MLMLCLVWIAGRKMERRQAKCLVLTGTIDRPKALRGADTPKELLQSRLVRDAEVCGDLPRFERKDRRLAKSLIGSRIEAVDEKRVDEPADPSNRGLDIQAPLKAAARFYVYFCAAKRDEHLEPLVRSLENQQRVRLTGRVLLFPWVNMVCTAKIKMDSAIPDVRRPAGKSRWEVILATRASGR
jgi:hypothetical protein